MSFHAREGERPFDLESKAIKQLAKSVIPAAVYRPVLKWLRTPRRVRWGSLRSTQPVSRIFGADRGLPLCRYYIEHFLHDNARDIQGEVLEIAEDTYTRRFGGERVVRSHVLHALDDNPAATLIADLTTGESVPTATFDCIILTQTLPFIYDVRAALSHLERSLKPGGVLLATFPGISQISRYDMDRWGDFWRFTSASARRLFEEFWRAKEISLEVHGNVLVATAYLQGIASEELREDELHYKDQDYPLLITVRARKALST
jgi:SAM-dependent methyltransferase